MPAKAGLDEAHASPNCRNAVVGLIVPADNPSFCLSG